MYVHLFKLLLTPTSTHVKDFIVPQSSVLRQSIVPRRNYRLIIYTGTFLFSKPAQIAPVLLGGQCLRDVEQLGCLPQQGRSTAVARNYRGCMCCCSPHQAMAGILPVQAVLCCTSFAGLRLGFGGRAAASCATSFFQLGRQGVREGGTHPSSSWSHPQRGHLQCC